MTKAFSNIRTLDSAVNANTRYAYLPFGDILKVFLLLFAGGFFVYGLDGQLFRTLYFSGIFVLFLSDRNKVFWIAFFWIMILTPWGLFSHRWNGWIIELTPTVGISYRIVLPFVMILKHLILEKKIRLSLKMNIFSGHFKVFAFYVVFLFLWGAVFGYSPTQLVFILGIISSYSLFFVLPKLCNQKELVQINRIVFLFSILLTITMMIDLMSGRAFTLFISFSSDRLTGTAISEGLIRATGGIYISLYSIIMAMYYMVQNRKPFPVGYLWLVVLISLLFIFSSATRGWMLASTFILIFFFIFYGFKTVKQPKIIFSVIFLVIISSFFMPAVVRQNLDASFNRLSTVEAITEGDMTAGGTTKRWDVRGPQVLTRFHESPVFGFGFSKVTHEFYDGHVGNHVLLLSGGYLGFVFFYVNFLYLVFYLFRLNIKNIAPGFGIFAIGLFGIVIIHSTSRNMLGFILPFDTAFFFGLLFNHINAYAEEYTKTINSDNKFRPPDSALGD